MIKLRGQKTKIHFDELIFQYLPKDIENWKYVEPFAGTFAIGYYLSVKPKISVYNDIKKYDFDADADVIEHLDFEQCIAKYDSANTIFYLDPPYFGKENIYGMKLRDKDFHIRLRHVLDRVKGMIILSYEDCLFIRNLYSDVYFKIIPYTGNSQILRNEITIIKK